MNYTGSVRGSASLLALLGVLASTEPADARETIASSSRVVRSRDVEIETRRLALHGVPLRGAFETVVLRDGAPPRVVASRRSVVEAERQPHEARLAAEDASAIIRARDRLEPRSAPQLVYVLVLGRPLLAWEVELPLEREPIASLRTVWISAMTGRVLGERDAAWSSRARVFPLNPVRTPEPVDAELTSIDATEAGVPLVSPGVEVLGCGPESAATPPPWWNPGECVPVARALSDANGDWIVPLPDVGLVEDNRAVDDLYAEVAAYHHVERFLDAMTERGVTTRRCERFTVVVNRHSFDEEQNPSPSGGAQFVDNCDPEVSPTLLIGQGKDVDYAYDADVLYHEMGHSVVQDVSPLGLFERRYGRWGIVSESGAINEAIADYLAMSVSGDPELAEYIGRFDVASGSPYLRTADNTAVCPDDLIGEWHSDGRIVSGAMWALRSRLGTIVDEIVLRALTMLPADATLEDFGQASWQVAQDLAAEGLLDQFGLALAERSLGARGLRDCPHVIDDPLLATRGKRMRLAAADEGITPFAPGPFQLRYRVPADATEVTVFFSMTAEGSDAEAAGSLLVKRADEPIAFAFDMVEMMEGDDGVEVIQASGDYDLEIEAESLNGEDFIARLAVTPGEVLHVALANRSATPASVSNFFVVKSDPFAVDEDDGCACRAVHGGSERALLLGLLVLGIGRRRP